LAFTLLFFALTLTRMQMEILRQRARARQMARLNEADD
jgi:hypothetical protein